MKPTGLHAGVLAAVLLAVVSGNAAGQASERDRRYLNEVFADHIRTADIVFAERYNDTTDKTEKITMRVFEPKGDKADKRVLFILTPGGGFVAHGEHWMDDYGEKLARAGYVVAVNRYRLSDSIAGPEKYANALAKAYADHKAVIDYFLEDARGDNRFRIDPDNIFIGGHSAGGITSMHVAYLDPDDDIDPAMAEAMKRHGGIEATADRLRGVINMSGGVTDLGIMDNGGPPLMSMHGDRDGIVPIGTSDRGLHGSIPIHRHAESVGLSNELHVIKGALHNDPADSHLCPECVPLTKRFMFNRIVAAEQ